MINLILLGLFVLLVGFGVLGGFLKGLGKARIRGICVIACAIAAVALTLILRKMLISQEVLDSLLAEIGNAKVFEDLMAASPSLCKILLNCLSSLASPILCLLIYFVLAFVTWIVYLIVTIILHGALRRHNQRCKLSKLRACIWGGVKGLVVFVMLMIPISAYLEIATPVTESLLKAEVLGSGANATLENIHDNYLKPANNGVVKVYRNLGGKLIVNSLTDFKLDKKNVDFSEEIGAVASFGCNVMQLTKNDISNYGEAESKTFNAIADSFGDSVLLPTITGDLIYGATDSWLKDEEYMGASKPSTGELSDIFDPFMQTLLEILHTDARNQEALQNDFHTVADMIGIFSNHGVFNSFSNMDNLMTSFSGEGIVTEMVNTLGANDSMKRLIPEITNMGVRAIGSTLGISKDVSEEYDHLLAEISKSVNYAKTSLPEADRAAYLTKKLGSAFDEAGVPIAQEILVCYSASMLEDFVNNGNRTAITTKDVQAFFEIYAQNATSASDELSGNTTETLSQSETLATDLYAGTVYAGKTDEELKETGAAVLSDLYASMQDIQAGNSDELSNRALALVLDAYENMFEADSATYKELQKFKINKRPSEDDYAVAAGLNKAESLQTQKVLLENLLIDSKAAAEVLNATTLVLEANVISAIFDVADSLQNQMSYGSDELQVDQITALVGNILDALRQSSCYGSDKTASLFTAIMQSKTLRDLVGIDFKTASLMAQKGTEGDTNYGKTLSVISSTVNVLNSMGASGEQPSEEALMDLVRNITPQSAGMLEAYDTASKMEEYDVPTEYAEISSSLLSSTFKYMANANLTEEEYAREADALNQVMNIAMSAKENSTATSLFAKDGESSVLPGSATETVNALMASSAVCSALRENMLNEDGSVAEGREDALGIGTKLSGDAAETEQAECRDAMQAYYESNPTEENKQSLRAISALLGVSVEGSFLG